MRVWRSFAVAMVFVLGAGCVCAQQEALLKHQDSRPRQISAELTQIAEVKALSTADAAQSIPVRLRGMATTLSGWKNSFFLQNGTAAISVDRTDSADVQSGDEVEVVGVSAAGMFAPVVSARQVTVLKAGTLPKAEWPKTKVAEFADLATGRLDSTWVRIEGVVRAEAVSEMWGRQMLFLTLRSGGANLSLLVLNYEHKDQDLVDAKVVRDGLQQSQATNRSAIVCAEFG
jgi:hypothetical protein